MKKISLNPGSQRDFVFNEAKSSAYIGGLGSGKTFAGLVRGLEFSRQPKVGYYGPRGCVAAISNKVLEDVVLTEFFEMMDGAGLWRNGTQENSYLMSKKKALLKNGAEILFRSLDEPNWMRGLNLSWFFIDEGRHVHRAAWDILKGRLRQNGYRHGGWVCSTPNGFDWMWELFHPDSENHLDNAVWFGASTMANEEHLPEDYVPELRATYKGRFYEQEVLGKFVGVIQGGVFYHWNPDNCLGRVPYDPTLPLFSAWDFGVGDPGVCHFLQVEDEEIKLSQKSSMYLPHLRVVGTIEEKDWTSKEWAGAFYDYCDNAFDGRRPEYNVGDPAGRQRNHVTATSVIDDLAAHGVHIAPAPRKPPDYSIRILDNMMAGDRVHVDSAHCQRTGAALSQYKWPVDADGNKTGTTPVHDWTSHLCDPLRYFAAARLSYFPRHTKEPVPTGMPKQSVGYIVEQILKPPEPWLGAPRDKTIDWQVGSIGPRETE